VKRSIGPKPIVYPAPVFIVGTYDETGRANAAAVAWGGICCSQPPCVAVALRAATSTHGNIKRREAFTVNIPSADYVREADYFGMASGRNVDKLSVAGLAVERSALVDAPLIVEFPLALECRLLHTVEIGLHTQFVGEILDIKAEESVVEDGLPRIKKVNPFLFAPDTRDYYAVGEFLAQAFSAGKGLTR
jgi:flavin reductase (DIM6/NTAB) family NADH-FMN oxidoreductase RutF